MQKYYLKIFLLAVSFSFILFIFNFTSFSHAQENNQSLQSIQPTFSPLPSRDPDPTLQPSPSPTPKPTPTFSCCEHDIKVNKVEVVADKTVQGAGTITVTIDFKLDLHWKCKLDPEKNCLAFYEITLEDSNWQEFVGGKWEDIKQANISESIIPDQPLTSICDGKNHKGTWEYSYIATITTVNPIRNTSLVFDWDIPDTKGTSYHSEYEVSGVSKTTGTKPPTVKGSHPKKK